MKTIKENFKLIVVIICLIGICYSLVNLKNPEMSQTQLFLKLFWWLYIICVMGIIYGNSKR